ncbi:hypothetical protein GCM10011505_06450 [Tistrella bauzanensis]|uniref:Uncharacterized protein n=1 Tax=Tistrella bauzanensis TaxID=657419 RepID=A0ABQ1I8Q1_9PROT|nr:hypothetical protein [Tistrella bauzanensis]GGB27845.1 hypothetical protein GCM10011505_06450 [Tistrella bauzanensis]
MSGQGRDDHHVDPTRLQVQDLGVDRRIGEVESLDRDDVVVCLVAEAVAQTRDVILAEIIGLRPTLVSGMVSRMWRAKITASVRFCGRPVVTQGFSAGASHFDAPELISTCGTFLAAR